MPSINEALTGEPSLGAVLTDGTRVLSQDDAVVFTLYVRLVLPADGFVFWVKANLLTESALFNSILFNAGGYDQGLDGAGLDTEFSVMGSLHIASNQTNQAESETEGVSLVVFTSESPVQQFTTVRPNTLWVGTYQSDRAEFDAPIKFAFSSRGSYYMQANLYHYSGTALLPAFQANLIDDVAKIINMPLYASNSLPAWLAFSHYDPPYDNGVNNHVQLYPSFLVPDNLPPPYGVVHIDPQVQGFQSAPLFDATLGQYSLTMERVRVTLYGLTNDAALMFLSAFCQYSFDYETVGLSNMPTIKDEKRIQSEMGLVALKKSIDFDIWYDQQSMRNVARQQFKKIFNNYYPQPLTAVGFGPEAP